MRQDQPSVFINEIRVCQYHEFVPKIGNGFTGLFSFAGATECIGIARLIIVSCSLVACRSTVYELIVKGGEMKKQFVLLSLLLCMMFAGSGCSIVGHPAEGRLESFMGEPKLDIQQVHKGDRFPNIVVAVDGTVLALWGGVKVRRSEDGGETWGDEITVGNGFMGGGAIVNETNGDDIDVEHANVTVTMVGGT